MNGMPAPGTPADKLRRALILTGVIILSTVVYVLRLSFFFAGLTMEFAVGIIESLNPHGSGSSATETRSFPLPERIPRRPKKTVGDTNILIDQDNIATHGGVINAPIGGNVVHPDAHYRRRRTR